MMMKATTERMKRTKESHRPMRDGRRKWRSREYKCIGYIGDALPCGDRKNAETQVAGQGRSALGREWTTQEGR
eukprot:750937-Hanusia_phi.AAC.5